MDPTRSHDASKNREEDHILRMATDLARLSAELDGLSPPVGGAHCLALEDAQYAIHRAAVALGELLTTCGPGPTRVPA